MIHPQPPSTYDRPALLKRLGDLPHSQTKITTETLELLTGIKAGNVSDAFEVEFEHLWFQIMSYHFCRYGLVLFNRLLLADAAKKAKDDEALFGHQKEADDLYLQMNLSYLNIVKRMEANGDVEGQRVIFRRMMDNAYLLILADSDGLMEQWATHKAGGKAEGTMPPFDTSSINLFARSMLVNGMLLRPTVVMSLKEIFRNVLGDAGVENLISQMRES